MTLRPPSPRPSVPEPSKRESVTLAFWECGHIEVDQGKPHECDGRDVCSAAYREYVPPPERGIAWPSDGQRARAETALATERERRVQQAAMWADDLGVPYQEPKPLTDGETVLRVLWGLRGDA